MLIISCFVYQLTVSHKVKITRTRQNSLNLNLRDLKLHCVLSSVKFAFEFASLVVPMEKYVENSKPTSTANGVDDDVISAFICPITLNPMNDPVIAADGIALINMHIEGNIFLIFLIWNHRPLIRPSCNQWVVNWKGKNYFAYCIKIVC